LISMKAVVFGGAGVIGSFAVECLTNMDTFTNITIADAKESKARQICKKNNKISFVKLDATDEKSISNSLKNVDVAVNCVGPFYKFAPKIMSTVIKKGINYVDVCDDYDATQKLLDDYHKKAEDAGSTCIVGLGASPGLTNIIAAFAANQLTSVDSIKVYVTRSIEEESGGAIPYHMLHCWLGKIPIYSNGRFQKVDGLIDGEEYATFPEPFGQSAVYYFGHPETVTFPRYIKGVKNVCCKGSFFPADFRLALLQLQSLGFLSETPINVHGQKIKPLDFTARYIDTIRKNIISNSGKIPSGGSVMVEVSGKDDSEPRTIKYAGTSHMRNGTATPAAVGAKMLAEKNIEKPGVYAPEGCIPPEEFVMHFMNVEGFGDVWLTFTQKMSGDLL
jgi:saccharopine dehydrogenase (NAD+, L-lysine-forming)